MNSADMLFLDDNRERGEKFLELYPEGTWVKTVSECIVKLQTEQFTTLLLDFDLTSDTKSSDLDDPLSGMEVVRWLDTVSSRFANTLSVVIHSHNVPASNEMKYSLWWAGYNVHYQPFGFGSLWN